MRAHALDDHRHVGQPPRPFFAAGEEAAVRLDDDHAARAEALDVLDDGGVLQHEGVHCRRDHDVAAMGDGVRRERVVGDAGGEFGEAVGRRRRDEEKLGPAGQLDVIDAAVTGIAPLIEDDAVIGNRGERERRHEPRRVGSEDDAHVRAGIAQPAHEVGSLVCGNAAGHAENHAHASPCVIPSHPSAQDDTSHHSSVGSSSSAVGSSTGSVSCHFT